MLLRIQAIVSIQMLLKAMLNRYVVGDPVTGEALHEVELQPGVIALYSPGTRVYPVPWRS